METWKTSDKGRVLLGPLPSATAESVCNFIKAHLNIDSEIYTH